MSKRATGLEPATFSLEGCQRQWQTAFFTAPAAVSVVFLAHFAAVSKRLRGALRATMPSCHRLSCPFPSVSRRLCGVLFGPFLGVCRSDPAPLSLHQHRPPRQPQQCRHGGVGDAAQQGHFLWRPDPPVPVRRARRSALSFFNHRGASPSPAQHPSCASSESGQTAHRSLHRLVPPHSALRAAPPAPPPVGPA